MKGRLFVDTKTIAVASGRGGAGCVSFLREKSRPRGPPNGGDGGDGGSVFVQAVSGETSLHRVPMLLRAGRGSNGMGSSRHGQSGSDVLIQVPIGTVIRETSRVERYANPEFVHFPRFKEFNEQLQELKDLKRQRHHSVEPEPIQLDLTQPGDPIRVLPGGSGGKGNIHFQSPTLRSPRFATAGKEGYGVNLRLELKLLADIGLVGFPNAGKSTLLRSISNAKPQVGHWAFTTLNPHIGTITYGPSKMQFTVADIPGLVAGSSDKKGLGLEFLRHVERAAILAFVLDLSRPQPWNDLATLHQEIEAYGKIHDKRYLVVANKADIDGSREKFKELRERGVAAIPVSAQRSEGVDTVIDAMAQLLQP